MGSSNSKKVIVSTLLLLVILATLTFSMGIAFKDGMSIPGTESEKALKSLEKGVSKWR